MHTSEISLANDGKKNDCATYSDEEEQEKEHDRRCWQNLNNHKLSYVGITEESHGRWRAKFSFNGTRCTVGLFATAKKAAKAYDRVMLEYGPPQ